MKDFLEKILNKKVNTLEQELVPGGSINKVYRLVINDSLVLCCKINDAGKFPGMFEKEKQGLELLRSKNIIRIPEVLGVTTINTDQLLVMEWIEQGNRSENFWRVFGKQLSQLHRVKGSGYGLDYDNYMGALPQSNKKDTSWIDFFLNNRIIPQVKLAVDNGKLDSAQAKLFDLMPAAMISLFPDAEPCLLHGDLWSGNFLCDEAGNPVLIDPAVYYGHPAVDLGLTTMFGGYAEEFYQAYNYYNPFPQNYELQWDCCNLYPLLIHLNLFGKGYLGAILDTLRKFV